MRTHDLRLMALFSISPQKGPTAGLPSPTPFLQARNLSAVLEKLAFPFRSFSGGPIQPQFCFSVGLSDAAERQAKHIQEIVSNRSRCESIAADFLSLFLKTNHPLEPPVHFTPHKTEYKLVGQLFKKQTSQGDIMWPSHTVNRHV